MPEIIHLEQTHSTNNYLRHLVEATRSTEEGTVVWADFQSAGRGQQGNTWESEPSKNLLFTLLLCPQEIKARDQFVISQVVSLGIIDVLNELREGFSIKWPNDIYFGNKKVAGILIENDLSGQTLHHSYIGIGLNVNQEVFLSDAPNPISLFQITNEKLNREVLLEKILNKVIHYYMMALEEKQIHIQKLYMDRLFRNKGFHSYAESGRHFLARISHIHPAGHMTLVDENGKEKTYDFKEVEFVI
ncbi:MAG: biotin--[acetyl-CoA-carboxylase] ligase [Bacteroidales bacterium]